MTTGDATRANPLVELDVDGPVATIRLNRPPLNVLSTAVSEQLAATAAEVRSRSDVRAVIVTGSDHVFAAGGDIAEMASMAPEGMDRYVTTLQAFTDGIAAIPVPTVSAIEGYALGGGLELALSTDFRFAGDSAVLGLPEIRLGIIPGAGGTQRLARLVGPTRAKDLVFTGRRLTAAEALALGIVDEVTAAGDAYARAVEWAQALAAGPTRALIAAKHAIDRGVELDLTTGCRLERELIVPLFATHDQKAGMAAFLTKHSAKFNGD
ncbi:enoyl-CoA hydratase/isomerase family protein [Agromyces sp. SYSU T00266]|uniref:enoyl-CoA hydratase/isomerase family protein n=1 Tax=Agromyces zhanjiangensis TaxID=3158562 RepID=UPI00339A0519